MFIARQPIFNSSMDIYGYELLYRDSETAQTFGNTSAKKATATVLGGLFEIGLEKISDGRRAFINFDYDFLLSDSMELMEPEDIIIEVLETVEVDDKIIGRLTDLKGRGYRIALDDFVEDYEKFPLVPLSNIIKYDLMARPLDTIELEVKRALMEGKTLLAEKVETQEEYEKAEKMGFHLFQGYFFEKPSIIGKSNNKKSTKLNYIKLINELRKPEARYNELAKIIKTDVNLSYRLLSVIEQNKSENDPIHTIRRSLVYMGFRKIERWINILMLQDLATDKPLELTRLSLLRSEFGELLAENSKLKSRKNEIYGMLLFSTLDAILDQPMEEALDQINLSEDIRQALIHGDGEIFPILDLVYSYEKGDWNKVNLLSSHLKIDQNEVSNYYLKALEYSNETMDMI